MHSNKKFLEKTMEELSSDDYSWIYEKIEKSNNKMPTDFQDSHFYDKITQSFDILKETMLEKDIFFNGNKVYPKDIPLFGTADLKGYNAFIETEDEPVIVFNNDLLMLTEELISLYTKEHWLISKKQMTRDFSILFTKNFIDIMLCFYWFSNAYFALPIEFCDTENLEVSPASDEVGSLSYVINKYTTNEQYFLFYDEMKTSVYLWVAAHEYSHLLLGHIKDHSKDDRKISLSNLDERSVHFAWQQEYDADLLGAIITMESESSIFLSCGIYFALNSIRLSHLYIVSDETSSHPPVELRINNIFEHIKSNKSYLFKNYNNIDLLILPKYKAFIQFLKYVDKKNLVFETPQEMQKYLYKKYDMNYVY